MNLEFAQDRFLPISLEPIGSTIGDLFGSQDMLVPKAEAQPSANASISEAQDALRLAKMLESQGELRNAAEAYHRFAQLWSTPQSWFVLGIMYYYQIGEYEKATSSLRRSLSINRKAHRRGAPSDLESAFWAHVGLAAIYARMDKPLQALPEITHAIRFKPKSGLAFLLLGDIRRDLKQWQEAITAFEEAIRLEPDLQQAYLYLADLYTKLADQPADAADQENSLRGAMLTYERLIERFPSDSSHAHNNLGVLYSRTGDREQAIGEYAAAVDVDPANVRAQINLAAAYLASGRLEEAEAAFERAAALSQHDARVSPIDRSRILDGRAITLLKLHSQDGEKDQELLARAESALLDAIELDPTSPEPRNNLATLHAGIGRFDDAEKQFNKVLELEPENQFARGALSELAVARYSPGPPGDPKEEQRVRETLQFLRRFREEGDEEEQRETFARLRQALEEDRMSNRPLFSEYDCPAR